MSSHSSSSPDTLSYEQAGVNYDLIDPLKISAQRAAAATAGHLSAHGFTEVKAWALRWPAVAAAARWALIFSGSIRS